MIKRFFIPLLVILLLVTAGLTYYLHQQSHTPKSAKELFPVVRTVLTNGLQVLVVPTNRVPAVTHMLWVKAGGADDSADLPGLAHFLEHMMFTGTATNPAGAYDETITRIGGEHNAFTAADYTGYFATVPKEFLETVMVLEADRLMNLNFSEENVQREIKVISEERAMRVDNQPTAQLREHMRAMQFLAHPYRQPVIGWPDSIDRFNAADAKKFRDNYYRASNMVLVVVGDVDAQQVHNLAANHYGKLPTAPKPPRRWAAEPPLLSKRSVTIESERVAQPRLVRSYTAPFLNATRSNLPELFALDVLGEYLGADRTGVLYRMLVRDQRLATDVSVRADGWSLGPGTLTISVALSDGTSFKQAERALDQALENITAGMLSPDRLTQAQTTLSASALFAQDGLMSLAQVFGQLAALDLPEDVFYRWQDSIHAVSAREVQAVAQKLFTQSVSVTGYLQPASAKDKPQEPPSVPMASLGGHHAL